MARGLWLTHIKTCLNSIDYLLRSFESILPELSYKINEAISVSGALHLAYGSLDMEAVGLGGGVIVCGSREMRAKRQVVEGVISQIKRFNAGSGWRNLTCVLVYTYAYAIGYSYYFVRRHLPLRTPPYLAVHRRLSFQSPPKVLWYLIHIVH